MLTILLRRTKRHTHALSAPAICLTSALYKGGRYPADWSLINKFGTPVQFLQMPKDSIAEIGIDDQERLYIRPSTATFPLIYREGVEVHWDATRRYLHSPKPREWSYLQWFQHIIDTAAILYLTPSTVWTNITEELKSEMQHWLATRASNPDESQEQREQRARETRKLNYHAIQEPQLKIKARELFFQRRYSDVVRIESQIQYPEFLSPSEQQLFTLARKRQ